MLFPTCNTYARTFTFTQSTTRVEMKIVITYTHSLTHSRLIVCTQSLTGIITFLSLSVAVDLKFQGIFGYTAIDCVERTYRTGDVTGSAAH